jgi:hypothetical protein
LTSWLANNCLAAEENFSQMYMVCSPVYSRSDLEKILDSPHSMAFQIPVNPITKLKPEHVIQRNGKSAEAKPLPQTTASTIESTTKDATHESEHLTSVSTTKIVAETTEPTTVSVATTVTDSPTTTVEPNETTVFYAGSSTSAESVATTTESVATTNKLFKPVTVKSTTDQPPESTSIVPPTTIASTLFASRFSRPAFAGYARFTRPRMSVLHMLTTVPANSKPFKTWKTTTIETTPLPTVVTEPSNWKKNEIPMTKNDSTTTSSPTTGPTSTVASTTEATTQATTTQHTTSTAATITTQSTTVPPTTTSLATESAADTTSLTDAAPESSSLDAFIGSTIVFPDMADGSEPETTLAPFLKQLDLQAILDKFENQQTNEKSRSNQSKFRNSDEDHVANATNVHKSQTLVPLIVSPSTTTVASTTLTTMKTTTVSQSNTTGSPSTTTLRSSEQVKPISWSSAEQENRVQADTETPQKITYEYPLSHFLDREQ